MPNRPRPTDGWQAWTAVLAVVLGVEGRGRGHELLSEFAHRHRLIFVPLFAYLAVHFAQWPPRFHDRYDPLHLLAVRLLPEVTA